MKTRNRLPVMVGIIALMILVIPSSSQIKKDINPLFPQDPPRLLLNGMAHLFDGVDPAGADFLDAEISVKKPGKLGPVQNLLVTLNGTALPETNPGVYKKNILPFKFTPGQTLEIKMIPSHSAPVPASRMWSIATAKIDNVITYEYPTPNGTINTGISRFVTFRWNFSGGVKQTQLRIRDWDTKAIIFQKVVNGTSTIVPAKIFKPNKTYRIYQMGYDWGYFKLYRGAAIPSKIELGYAYAMMFKTK